LTGRNVVAEAGVACEFLAANQQLKPVGVSTQRFADPTKGSVMDENRFAGTAKNIGGKVEEGFGRVTGDSRSQVEGIANQAAGAAQDLYGQARDSASDAAGAVRDSAASLEKWLRHTVETQPYTTALVAVGVGWLLGRMHRPL
jgi:uncharacterized protein YjbJ (UPF0337 family)